MNLARRRAVPWSVATVVIRSSYPWLLLRLLGVKIVRVHLTRSTTVHAPGRTSDWISGWSSLKALAILTGDASIALILVGTSGSASIRSSVGGWRPHEK